MDKREYTAVDIKHIAEQLKDIKVNGKPVFDVDVEFSEYGRPHKITLSTWGTVAINEFPAKRDDDKSEWVKVRFVLNSLMRPVQALDQLRRMLNREYEGWEFIERTEGSNMSAIVHIKPRNDYEWSVSDRDCWESITSYLEVGLALKSWEVIEPRDLAGTPYQRDA